MAGLYENAPGDVPRIAALPAWNAIAIFDGDRWLDSTAIASGAIREYRQVLDMRSGTARTSYDWVNGARRTSVRIETSSPGPLRISRRSGSTLTPRVRRTGCGCGSRSPAGRLPGGCALATLTRGDPRGARPTSGIRGT